MYIFTSYPFHYREIVIIDYLSSETLATLSEQITLHYMLDHKNTSREALLAKNELEQRKLYVKQSLVEKATRLRANALANFNITIVKLDSKHIMIQAQAMALNIIDLPQEEITSLNAEEYLTVPNELQLEEPPTQLYEHPDVIRMMQDENIKKINGTIPDIGGTHQLNIVQKLQQDTASFDTEPLTLPSEQGEPFIPIANQTVPEINDISESDVPKLVINVVKPNLHKPSQLQDLLASDQDSGNSISNGKVIQEISSMMKNKEE